MRIPLLRRAGCAAAIVLALGLGAGSAGAYSTQSEVSDGCHESMTFSAIRGVREELVTAGPLAAQNKNERALLDDLPFSVPKDMRGDFAAASAVLGNRNVDLKHHEPDHLDYLAQVHGDPNNQDEHCLRAPHHDDPDGDQAALTACTTYISQRVQAALTGLGGDGSPDPASRSQADVYLELRGAVKVSLPTYWWEIGRALHAVQDGFSHVYRSQQDPYRVIAVMNYVEFVEDELDESIDGPPHSSGLDRCSDLDEFRKRRIQLGVDASADLLRATLDPSLDLAGKQVAVSDVLTRYLSYTDGCSAENNWCDAPERNYPEERGCVCSAPGSARGSAGWPWAAFAALGAIAAAVGRRRRRASRVPRAAALGAVLSAGAAVLLTPSLAIGQTEMAPAEEPMAAPYQPYGRAPESPRHEETVRVERDDAFPLGVHAAAGASIANPAGAVSGGLRWRLSEHWLIGADGEYNPFYSKTTEELRGGVTNVYGTLVVRFPMSFEDVNLRSTFNVGISRMNMDLYGVPEGSVGPFFGFNLLGVDIDLADQFYLVINPAYVAIPIPQTTGVPYAYPQYRISIGFQIGA
jgi:hypothetical protein